VYSLVVAAPYLNSPALDPDTVHAAFGAMSRVAIPMLEALGLVVLAHQYVHTRRLVAVEAMPS
jgi:hypothetical protein